MSIKSKVLAAAATLTLVGGVGMAGALPAGTASAATPSCGALHRRLQQAVRHAPHPNYTVDVFRQGERAGEKIILFRTANYDPAEDLTVAYQGTVADFYAAHMVRPRSSCTTAGSNPLAGQNSPDCYGENTEAVNDWAFENEYAPYGVDSGLCMGVATTAFGDEGVTLSPAACRPRRCGSWTTSTRSRTPSSADTSR